MTNKYIISFRCYYAEPGNYTTHKQELPLIDIARWIEAYKFTHPAVVSISVKVWFNDGEEDSSCIRGS